MYHISMYLGLNGYTKDYTLLPTFCTCKSNACDFLSDMYHCTKFLKNKTDSTEHVPATSKHC